MNLILTGGHSGIGLELTKRLVKDRHRLGLIVRSESKIAAAVQEIGTSENIDFFIADLSNQDQLKRVAAEIVTQWGSVDGLFNNAGVLLDKPYQSPQGNEMHYEVNTLAPYVLASYLKPALLNGTDPFVSTTLTGGIHSRKKLDVDDLLEPERFVKLLGSYVNSKQAAHALMEDLAARWQGEIRVIHVDPGPNKTKMTSGEGMPFWLMPIRNLFFPQASKGGKLLYDAAFDSKFAGQTGIYITGNKVRETVLKLGEADMMKLKSGIKDESIVAAN